MTFAEIASVLAVVVSAYSIFTQRRKFSADANEINTRANVSLLKPLTDRVDELEKEAAEWRAEREEWKIGIGLLLGQLVDNHIKPTWTPKGVTVPQPHKPAGGLLAR